MAAVELYKGAALFGRFVRHSNLREQSLQKAMLRDLCRRHVLFECVHVEESGQNHALSVIVNTDLCIGQSAVESCGKTGTELFR